MRQDRQTIQTPEGIEFALPLAGPVSRFLAWCVDLACVGVASSLVVSVLGLARVVSVDVATALAVAGTYLVSVGYAMTAEWYWRGQTVGKRLLRLRVVDEAGLALQPSQVVVRNLLRAVDVLPSLYLLGGAAMVCSRLGQRLGDVAAGTVVVRTRVEALPPLDAALAVKYNSLREHPRLVARLRQLLTPAEATLGLRALERRHRLDPEARVVLFRSLADHYRSRIPFPDTAIDHLADEQLVRNVVDVLFRDR